MRYKGEKGKAWESVKRSVRRREKDCFTCGARNLVGINAQAGHYKTVAIVGSNNEWSWRPEFIHLQCFRCNGVGQGMAIEYRKLLVKEFGEKLVKEFDEGYRKVRPIKDWKKIIKKFDAL